MESTIALRNPSRADLSVCSGKAEFPKTTVDRKTKHKKKQFIKLTLSS